MGGEKKKAKVFSVQQITCEISMCCGSKTNLAPSPTHQSQSDRGSEAPQTRGPFCAKLEGGASKTARLLPRFAFPERSQTHKFEEEQQSTPVSGRSSRSRRMMEVLVHLEGQRDGENPYGRVKDINTRMGRSYLPNVGNTMI